MEELEDILNKLRTGNGALSAFRTSLQNARAAQGELASAQASLRQSGEALEQESRRRAATLTRDYERLFLNVVSGRIRNLSDLGERLLSQLQRQAIGLVAQRAAGSVLGEALGPILSLPLPRAAAPQPRQATPAAGAITHTGTIRVQSAGNPDQVLDVETVRAVAAEAVRREVGRDLGTGTGPISAAFKAQRRET